MLSSLACGALFGLGSNCGVAGSAIHSRVDLAGLSRVGRTRGRVRVSEAWVGFAEVLAAIGGRVRVGDW